MSEYIGLLIDTTSIQQYVFSGNKLKENLGASYLVKEIYASILDKISIKHDLKGYIGGGNALLFFENSQKAKSFVKDWTKSLLINTPGLTTAIAISEDSISEFDLNTDKFIPFKNSLFNQLFINKNSYNPQVIVSSHGITADCKNTGLTIEEWYEEKADNSDYFSAVSYSKQNSFKDSFEKINKEFPEIGKKGYKFVNDLEKLGSSKGEDSHIAIVHIDGNGMGKRFEECKSLNEIQELSESVEKATKNAFKELLEFIIDNYENINLEIDLENKTMPIRPIILGGDDVTFVCDGRLGIYFAKIFLEAFENQEVSDRKKLTACAGVAITKLKYPFYRGYKLSEELCKNAKEVRKKEKNEDSWIDFHIAYGGISAELKEIRGNFYSVPQGNLLLRPYNVSENKTLNSFKNLIKNTGILKKFPNSKIKELREMLNLGKDSTSIFANELKARELKLPEIDTYDFKDNLFQDKITPYFDMIEFAEIYPSFELETKEKNND